MWVFENRYFILITNDNEGIKWTNWTEDTQGCPRVWQEEHKRQLWGYSGRVSLGLWGKTSTLKSVHGREKGDCDCQMLVLGNEMKCLSWHDQRISFKQILKF